MSVLTNSDKTGGVGLFMARWTSYTKLQISIKNRNYDRGDNLGTAPVFVIFAIRKNRTF